MNETIIADDMEANVIIHLWCGPRSLSTATMYSFAQRSDMVVVDEPLYSSYLHLNPSVYRPYREELLTGAELNPDTIIRNLCCSNLAVDGPRVKKKKMIFLKHIVKQVQGLDRSLLYNSRHRHVFLVRDPLEMILSWDVKADVHQEPCSLHTLSLVMMCELYSELRARASRSPIVICSEQLRDRPAYTLEQLCASLDIEFEASQLSWPPGPKPYDGLWAKYWYDNVHASTGFQGGEKPNQGMTISKDSLELYRDALPFYQMLLTRALGMDSLCPGSSCYPYDQLDPRRGHALIGDARNRDVLIWVGDRLLPREYAKVSVFDSSVQGGDAVWEGLRVYNSTIFRLEEHLDRLLDSSKAMAFANVPSKDFIKQAIFKTLVTNGMRDGAHIRLTLTRGAKTTSSMNPVFNRFGTLLLVVPEWKPVGDAATYDNRNGIKLITATNRRNSPQCVDSKIHHNNLINNILPKIQANYSGAADALMLDQEGFVSETNATNVFIVKRGVVYTPHADYCLPGVTRQTIIELVPSLGLPPVVEKRISLTEAYTADEFFTTGTMGELTPVREIDGRIIGNSNGEDENRFPITVQLQHAYRMLTQTQGYPFPDNNSML